MKISLKTKSRRALLPDHRRTERNGTNLCMRSVSSRGFHQTSERRHTVTVLLLGPLDRHRCRDTEEKKTKNLLQNQALSSSAHLSGGDQAPPSKDGGPPPRPLPLTLNCLSLLFNVVYGAFQRLPFVLTFVKTTGASPRQGSPGFEVPKQH